MKKENGTLGAILQQWLQLTGEEEFFLKFSLRKAWKAEYDTHKQWNNLSKNLISRRCFMDGTSKEMIAVTCTRGHCLLILISVSKIFGKTLNWLRIDFRGFSSHLGYWTGHEDYYDHTAQELYQPVVKRTVANSVKYDMNCSLVATVKLTMIS